MATIYFKQENESIRTLEELKEDILYKEYLRKLSARNNAEYEFGFVPDEYNRSIREIEARLISHISTDALWTWESGGNGETFYLWFEAQEEEEYVVLETPWAVRTYTLLFDFKYPNGYRRIEAYDWNGKRQTLHLTLA